MWQMWCGGSSPRRVSSSVDQPLTVPYARTDVHKTKPGAPLGKPNLELTTSEKKALKAYHKHIEKHGAPPSVRPSKSLMVLMPLVFLVTIANGGWFQIM